MATNQNISSPEKVGGVPVPTLDESLAQLEEALDLFVSNHSEDQFGKTSEMEEAPSITPLSPLTSPPKMPTSEPAPAVAAPVKDESFEQAIKELKQKIAAPQSTTAVPITAAEVVMRAPDEEEGKRRFPLLTFAQKRMLWLLAAMLVFFGIIGYLIWQRQTTDELRAALEKQENERLRARTIDPAATVVPVSEATTEPSPAAASTAGDQGLLDHVKQILMAYNPTAASTRYKIDVKEGVVTLQGEVQSQMEKDGVENVIKPLTGIKKIVNNLAVKGLLLASNSGPAGTGPVMYPQVNSAEAKRLEDALKRDLAEGAKRAEEERLRIEQQNAQIAAQRNEEAAKQEAARQEAERLRRQQTATVHNDEDAAFRKQAEERLKQREKEESERRTVAETPKAEAAVKPELPRAESSSLRSGTVTWQGVVKGVDDVVIRGTSASIQHVSGSAIQNAKGGFSAAMPNAPISVRLVAASGPSPIRIIQQPSAGNNYTTIVRVGDGTKADGKPHTFTLRWATQ